MTPIDIQVSRSKVSVEGQAYSLYVGEGALVFYKQLYSNLVFVKLLLSVKFFWLCLDIHFVFMYKRFIE